MKAKPSMKQNEKNTLKILIGISCLFVLLLLFGCTEQTYVVAPHTLSDLNIGIPPNYTSFDSNGTLTQYGSATTYEDALSPIIVQSSTAQAPTWDATFMQYYFHNDVLASQDYVFVQIQLSHKYKIGTPIECHLHWSPSSTNTGDVNFSLEYAWVGLGQTYTAPYKKISAKQAGSGVAMQSQIFSFPDLNANGEGFSSVLVGKLMRESAHSTDTFTGNAYVSYFDCHYEQDKLGSNNHYN